MTVPLTRDLNEIAAACRIVEAELAFQVDRLGEVDPSRSGSSPEHLERTRREYADAVPGIRRLLRYQEQRLARQGSPQPETEPYVEMFEGVSEASPFAGPASAHVEE
jgi:hypothetical protein